LNGKNYKGEFMNAYIRLILFVVAALFTLGSVQSGWASNFSVEPVRVILDAQHRTERMTVKNESDRPLTVLIKGYRWIQTVEGRDQYNETEDLTIFPRALTLAAGEERFVRVGIALPAVPQEQAFRIYLEEQPIHDEQALQGTSARLVMRLGIPVFAQPLKPEPALKIREMIIANGNLRHTLTNGGNSFATAEQISVSGWDDTGAELFAKNLGGVYLLAGSTRTFEVAIPKDQCRKISKISVTTRSEGKDQQNKLNMVSGACEGK
jgi:fimbrial chaperone protein